MKIFAAVLIALLSYSGEKNTTTFPITPVLQLRPLGYPAIARAAAVAGTVSLQLKVDKQGRVVQARASGAHPMLCLATEESVKTWRFNPEYFRWILKRPLTRETTLNMEFEYRFEGKPSEQESTQIILQLPKRVIVITQPAISMP
jgi:TonB family protein